LVTNGGHKMSKDIDALDTLDDYSDEEYSAFLEYTQLKDQCMVEPTTLYINERHEFLSEWTYFANADDLDVKVINGDTRIC
jgi:hypothetical protein